MGTVSKQVLVFRSRPVYVPEQAKMASMETGVGKTWFDAVVFDLDGTLVDTAPDILAHLNDMLAELSRPALDPASVRLMIGDGVKSLLVRGLEASGGMPADIDLDVLFHRYLARYTEDPVRLSKPFAGMTETLDHLQAVGIGMGVCTNKPQRATERVLAGLGLDRYFESVIGGDVLPVKKPDPTHLLEVLDRLDAVPMRSVLVGDSETDLKAARAAGVPCVLVSFGYTKIPARDLGADRVIDHAADLVPTLQAINPAPA